MSLHVLCEEYSASRGSPQPPLAQRGVSRCDRYVVIPFKANPPHSPDPLGRKVHGIFLDLRIQPVNLGLDFHGLCQRGHHPAVVLDVVSAQDALLSVFEPFVEHMVAADLVFPNVHFHALEVLRVIDTAPVFLTGCMYASLLDCVLFQVLLSRRLCLYVPNDELLAIPNPEIRIPCLGLLWLGGNLNLGKT